MTNFEYYIASGKGKEGWIAFVETAPFRTGGRAIDRYNNWLLEEHKEPILDDIEKEYISNIIKPFRDRVEYVSKMKNIERKSYYIEISLIDCDFIFLPYFKTSTKMYTGMEVNHKYTLKELNL